ncbi:MAG: hypothetical protein Q8P86_00585 [bacterium]|nr:hypothetical protein [bacterium]
MNTPSIPVPLPVFLQIQKHEMESPFNEWVTGEEVNHEPTNNELASHYISSGRAAQIALEMTPRMAKI